LTVAFIEEIMGCAAKKKKLAEMVCSFIFYLLSYWPPGD